jgi:hypothetical protein
MRPSQIAAATALLALACSDHVSSPNAAMMASRAEPTIAPAPSPPATDERSSAPAPSFWATQKLIRTGEVRIQVRDVTTALRATDSIARSQEALLADSRASQDAEGKRSAEVVLRVPSQRFASVVQALRAIGTVQSESIATQDVTKEYTDLETRLAVKEQTVARLRALLDTRTAKLADVLEVERELGRAVTELERMKGERRYYDQQIALSTIRLSLFERVPSQLTQITRPISEALQSAMRVLGGSVGALIYLLVAILPWVLVALGIAWLARRLRRRFWPGPSSTIPPAA